MVTIILISTIVVLVIVLFIVVLFLAWILGETTPRILGSPLTAYSRPSTEAIQQETQTQSVTSVICTVSFPERVYVNEQATLKIDLTLNSSLANKMPGSTKVSHYVDVGMLTERHNITIDGPSTQKIEVLESGSETRFRLTPQREGKMSIHVDIGHQGVYLRRFEVKTDAKAPLPPSDSAATSLEKPDSAPSESYVNSEIESVPEPPTVHVSLRYLFDQFLRFVHSLLGFRQLQIPPTQQPATVITPSLKESPATKKEENRNLSVQQAKLNLSSEQKNNPDLTIIIDPVSTSNGKYHFVYRLYSLRSGIPRFSDYPSPELNQLPAEFFHSTLDDISQMAQGNELNKKKMENIGTGLYEALFSTDFKNFYWKNMHNQMKNVVLISNEPWIPWELIRPISKEKSNQQEHKFFCEQFNLTRWIGHAVSSDSIYINDIALVVESSKLPSARKEVAAIKKLFIDKPIAEYRPTSADLMNIIDDRGCSLLHIISHGEYDKNNPDRSPLILAKNEKFTPANIGHENALSKSKPFVFLNACNTGNTGYTLTGIGGWPEAFVLRASCSCFIGTLWATVDESAYRFAEELYRGLFEGLTIGEAVRKARVSIRTDPTDPTWLSYVVYADPMAKISHGRLSSEGFSTVLLPSPGSGSIVETPTETTEYFPDFDLDIKTPTVPPEYFPSDTGSQGKSER